MYIGTIFWILMLLWLLGWWGMYWGPYSNNPNAPRFHGLLMWVLFFLLGWRAFGFMIQG